MKHHVVMHHADPSGVYQPCRVHMMHGCSTGELHIHTSTAFMYYGNTMSIWLIALNHLCGSLCGSLKGLTLHCMWDTPLHKLHCPLHPHCNVHPTHPATTVHTPAPHPTNLPAYSVWEAAIHVSLTCPCSDYPVQSAQWLCKQVLFEKNIVARTICQELCKWSVPVFIIIWCSQSVSHNIN